MSPEAPVVPDPAIEQRVRESFDRQQVMSTLGARLIRVAPGEVDIELPYRADLTQQHGYLHAGVLATILDSACGYAAYTKMPADAGVLSVEFRIHMLAPAEGEKLIARGRVIRAGRTISTCQADGYMVKGGEEKHVAMMTGTMMSIVGRGVTG
jgi:uncharacterized protein (TIGR00369 family)